MFDVSLELGVERRMPIRQKFESTLYMGLLAVTTH
jgi:hypothetical protein